MKKYTIPTVKYIELDTESLIAISVKDGSFDQESDILTQKQKPTTSMWDNWSE